MYSAVRLTLSFLTAGERTKYVLLVGVRALTGLLDVFGIALIGLIAGVAATQLDPGTGSARPVKLLGFTLPQLGPSGLLWLVVFVLVVFVIKAITAVLLVRGQAFFVAGVESRNAHKIVDFLLTGSLASVKRYSKADVQFALTGSLTYAFTGLMNNVATLCSEGFLLLVVTLTFFLVNPVVAIFALIYFGLVLLAIQVFISRSLKRSGQEAVAGTVQTINTLSDTLDAFREISVLHKQKVFVDRISDSRVRIAQSGATMTFLAGMPRYVVETTLILGVVILVAQQFFTGSLSTGLITVGVFLTGGVRMMASLLPLQSAIANMKQNVEQAATALDLLMQVRDRDARASAAAEHAADPVMPSVEEAGLLLDVAGVTYRYPEDDHDTIHGVSLRVEPGSYVAIVGPSGAGKTTIVDLILGLIEPDSGAIAIGNVEPTAVRAAVPGLVSYVPQRPGLISGSIADNITLGVEPEDVDHELLRDVVEASYLREFIDSLPEGLNTSVGKQVDSLSGGQIQRIGVARALYSQPRLLVLDEATSGLDAGSEAFISASLRRLHHRVTVIVIAHRLSSVQHADVVHVVESGRITASGDFKTVQATVPMVAEYVKLMSFDDASEPTAADGTR